MWSAAGALLTTAGRFIAHHAGFAVLEHLPAAAFSAHSTQVKFGKQISRWKHWSQMSFLCSSKLNSVKLGKRNFQ